MREIVAARDLSIGMFVAELDRPWLESPFLLQGFLIEDATILEQVRRECRFVYVDRSRSVGEAWRPDPKEQEGLRGRRPAAGALQAELAGRRRPLDFFALLRALRSGGLGEQGEGEAVDVGAPGVNAAETEVPLETEIAAVLPVIARAQGVLEQIAHDVQSSLNPDLERVRSVVAEMVLSVARNPDALLWLVRLKQTDRYSYDHSLDVAAHVMIFGRALGLGEDAISTLGIAGMLQDVGKLRLPHRLLHKSGGLTSTEYEIFKTHVDYSKQILSASPHASQLMLEIVAKHHERVDGSGYPVGLRGEAVGIMAEIAGICDVYCAMTRERPYGPAESSQAALDAVRAQRGTRFSESVVDQFVQCIGLYPVGTLVELNSGEVAVVVAQNRIRRLKPRVMILLGPDKKPNTYPQTVDLLYDRPGAVGEQYFIVKALPPGAYGLVPSEFYLA
ncbi:HD-GYP domain-containing protein [Zoogloea sp. LCSB751]|uniref:HD-GYP domain-containing protein n=1 Tax=Zoogloea sp. LCSB751 TaxID=1965277 RepID=UPI0020B1060C|nr:HD-GYP domain-containing protein [Zoogloea sp. LCSB751]